MALRALLFSKNPETAETLTSVLAEAGIRAEICADIFSAIEKGTKQAFPCIVVDWPDQPEASFLLKRARESGINRSTVAIAVVNDEPPADQQRDHRLDFLIYRPIALDEARAVLAKARQKMQLQSAVFSEDLRAASPDSEPAATPEPDPDDPNLVSIAADLPKKPAVGIPEAEGESEEPEPEAEAEPRKRRRPINFKPAVAVVALAATTFLVWKARPSIHYLATTREGGAHVLRESIASLFYVNRSGAASVGAASTDSQQDAYFTRTAADSKANPANIGILSAEIRLPDNLVILPKPFDFPLPTPEMAPREVAPPRVEHKIPDSIRASAPIANPPVVTVSPAQIMPVSAPVPGPTMHQVSEPVSISEDSVRALMISSVAPVYPPEAAAQRLQGPVVLQALIGRDGSIQELKLVRGYFVLSRAAIAAVKQWRFRPYTVNGQPVQAQTTLTINFSPTS